MRDRPELTIGLKSNEFLEYYYLKEEMVRFCKENGMPSSGSKQELTERISVFLDTGKVQTANKTRPSRSKITEISRDTIIEPGIVCSEIHRAFFKREIGDSFSFNVEFQKWLKDNSGKTYAEAIAAYKEIKNAKKSKRTIIGKQFEYNTYIRDFFEDNKGASLEDAIKCWKYKKSIKGHNRYERTDLQALAPGAKVINGERFSKSISEDKLRAWAEGILE